MLFLVKLNPEFSSLLLEEAKAPLAFIVFIAVNCKVQRNFFTITAEIRDCQQADRHMNL